MEQHNFRRPLVHIAVLGEPRVISKNGFYRRTQLTYITIQSDYITKRRRGCLANPVEYPPYDQTIYNDAKNWIAGEYEIFAAFDFRVLEQQGNQLERNNRKQNTTQAYFHVIRYCF
jgi:hypothetical protein